MKSLTVLWLAAAALISFSGKSKIPAYDLKFIEKNLSLIPTGSFTMGSSDDGSANKTAGVESFYMFNQEVSNGFYLHYLHYLQDLQSQGKTDLRQKALPDTLVWRDKLTFQEPYTEYYLRHPAYRDYPVVGITYEQCIEFCNWLTQTYNADPKRKFKKVVFTLPDSVQREYAAQGGFPHAVFSWKGRFMQDGKGLWQANFSKIDQATVTRTTFLRNTETGTVEGELFLGSRSEYAGIAGFLNDNEDITAPVTSYEPNGYGLYNMSGNVEEFLLQKGKTMGGSWMDPGYYLQNHIYETYDISRSASRERGFRFVMKVLEE